jgi:hypothetical protein
MGQVFELNFIIFLVHQNSGKEMFFQARVIGFCYNELVGVVGKRLRAEGQELCWQNGKWLDEDDVV